MMDKLDNLNTFVEQLIEGAVPDNYLSITEHPEELNSLESTIGIQSGTIETCGLGCSSSDQAIYFILSNGNLRVGVYLAKTCEAPTTSKLLGITSPYFVYVDDMSDDGMLSGEPSPKAKASGYNYIDSAIHALGVKLTSALLVL